MHQPHVKLHKLTFALFSYDKDNDHPRVKQKIRAQTNLPARFFTTLII